MICKIDDYFSINRKNTSTGMKDFQYCLWLMIDDENGDFETMDFTPHISIRTNMDENFLSKSLPQLSEPLVVQLGENIQSNLTDDFFAIYYPVHLLTAKKPKWWKESMHVSVFYAYGKEYEIDTVLQSPLNKLSGNKYTCSEIKLFDCHGHFKTWKEKT